MTTNHESNATPLALPPTLADIALIDAATCAAAGAMSVSWWHEEVRTGRAPAPVIRKPRCTRWRLADVRAFWMQLSDDSAAAGVSGAQASARAKKASEAARAARAAGVRAKAE